MTDLTHQDIAALVKLQMINIETGKLERLLQDVPVRIKK